jgi:DnaJ-class molecular chaperone
MKNYYTILAISQEASQLEIKTAYRKLALQYHPDKNKSHNASEKFIEITEAYDILIDIVKRAEYDKQFESIKNSTLNYYNQEFTEWVNNSRQQARSDAEMNYKDFKSKIGIHVDNLSNLGCMAIFILCGASTIIFTIAGQAEKGKEGGAIIGSVFAVIVIIVLVRYFKGTWNSYQDELKK